MRRHPLLTGVAIGVLWLLALPFIGAVVSALAAVYMRYFAWVNKWIG